ncbi:LPS export ABC transporter permease LptG [Methylomonas sp. HYX-M1]|uniref:LPS export ABC transporter permease LptG n=1 Tax=Methylomonas sp. HYX-M1 TaxID=3139307 RepID=UPI00345BD02A
MNVLSYYIIREVTKGALLALLLLLTLFNLFTFSDELKDLGNGNYGLKQVLWYLVLTSPRVTFELIPSAALLGSLFVVGAMANNREIVAMRAAGFSTFWIIRNIMLAGLILVVLAVAIGELVAPASERTAQVLKTTAQNNGVVLRSQYGMWLREGNRFINVRKILDDGSLGDVRIFEIDEQHRLISATRAAHGIFLGEQRWTLQNAAVSIFNPDRVDVKSQAEMPWQSGIDADLLKVAVVNSDNLSLYDLYMYIDFLNANQQKAQRYELAFWSRLINPWVTFVMLMVSVPLVIGIGRGIGAGGRITLGVLIGMTFNILDRIVGHMGLIYDVNPMLIAVMPSLTVFLIATATVWRLS